MKMEQTECFETSAYKIQTSRNYPEESIPRSAHGESLKSGMTRVNIPARVLDFSVHRLVPKDFEACSGPCLTAAVSVVKKNG